MKYITAISTLLVLNIAIVVTLIKFSSLSREVEKENKQLQIQISTVNEQLKINEVEFNSHHQYSYLKKLQRIYFDIEEKALFEKTRISLNDFKDKEFINVHKVSAN